MAIAVSATQLAGCAFIESLQQPRPVVEPTIARLEAPVAMPAIVPMERIIDPVKLREEARALLAQAETDIQRARSRRALWSKAWEALVGARAMLAARDPAGAIELARRASELAQLGLEQLAYPAVKNAMPRSPS